MMAVDVLVPTFERRESLIMTLAGVAGQTLSGLRVVVADQGRRDHGRTPVIDAIGRIIEARGGAFEWHDRPQVHGIAEQRQFLLERASADAVLFVDDDVFMEPPVVERLLRALEEERCGFVGAFPAGLSFRDDARPEQQRVEFWDGRVRPESLTPGGPGWERWHLHRAANAWHAARALAPGEVRRYKVAWVACCVLYDRRKLLEAGGFSFWPRLPRYHSGEEVLVQNLLMPRWGGCALLPSGTYHSELPSTVLNDTGRVDGHALSLLDEMLRSDAASVRATLA